MKKFLSWLNENVEPVLMIIAYAVMAILVFEQVLLRFVFKTQIGWSSTVAVYMFIWVTWLGASYNVRKRSHLSFGEVRAVLPYGLQFACLLLDAALWLSLSAIVIYYSIFQIELLQMNYSIVPGTTNVMQWWFNVIMPFGWGLIILRTVQNLWEDIAAFRKREPFVLNMPMIAD